MKVDHPEKILIIRLSSIGDILLSSAFIRQIRKHFPDSQIDYLLKEQFAELLRFNPNINNLLILNTKKKNELKEIKHKLKKTSYTIIFDLHNNIRSNFLKRGIGVNKIRSIDKNKLIQFLLVHFKINRYCSVTSIPERYLNIAADFNVQDDNLGLELFWQEEQSNEALRKSEDVGLIPNEHFICLAPGAAHFTKRWPVESFFQVSEKIEKHFKIKMVILGGKSDMELGKYLSRPGQVYDLTGRLSLLESAIILSKSIGVITNDSGLMHMATAVNIPVLAVFGSTVREFGFFPFRGKARVLENKYLSCRPCTHIGRQNCPKKHFDCMMKISSDDVFSELDKLIFGNISPVHS